MKSNEIFYSKGKNDECYTPKETVLALFPFVEKYKDKTIWLPFDTKESQFTKTLSENGYKIIHSHISEGKDYYNYEPQNWDVMISNPPFTNKRKIFERAMSFNKPFALLMNIVWLNDKAPKEVFNNEMQLFLLKERVNFLSPKGESLGRPTFASAFFCRNFLPKDICVEK